MAVIEGTEVMARRKRPPLGSMTGDADHTHPEATGMEATQQRQGIGEFMAAIEAGVGGRERTMDAEAEAGLRGDMRRMMSKPLMQPMAGEMAPKMSRPLTQQAPDQLATPPVAKPMMAQQQAPPAPETPPTEREGGDIPMERDVWKSQAAAAEFERRMETLQLEQQITQMRDVAGHHEARRDLLRREGEQKASEAELAERSAELRTSAADLLDRKAEHVETAANEQAALERLNTKTRADVTRQEGQMEAEDARRREQLANLSAEEKAAQFEAFQAEAEQEIQEIELQALEEQANARVLGASRGTGGTLGQQQSRSIMHARDRKVGRIGTQLDARRQLKDLGVAADDIRAQGAAAAAEHARSVSELQASVIAETGRRRAELIESEGRIDRDSTEQQADQQRLAAEMDGLNADNLRITSAQTFLRSDAEEKSATYARTAADITAWGLDNRPPIPDYVHIGKQQERQQTLRNLGSGLGLLGGAIDLFRKFF